MTATGGVTNAGSPPAPDRGGPDGPVMAVYLTNAVRTSAGPSQPGPVTLPVAEARSLVNARLAWPGDRPPAGYDGCL